MNRLLTIVLLLICFLGACRDSPEVAQASSDVSRADLIGKWRAIDGEDPWAYDFMEDGRCATFAVKDDDPFGGDSEYDYFHGFTYYWYMGRMDGVDIIILDNPRDSDWDGIMQVTLEGERLVMTALVPEEKTRRLTPYDHKFVFERVKGQE